MAEKYPEWSSFFLDQNKKDTLSLYCDWLSKEGIKKGLISNKTKEYIWEEFIIHSLGFTFIINTYFKSKKIFDLGSGAGIPGIPLAITSPEKTVYLIERSKKRYFELERLKVSLDIKNIQPVLSSAEVFVEKNKEEVGIYISRCFMPKEKLISKIFYEKSRAIEAILVSSNQEQNPKENEIFHVKQEKIIINNAKTRNIDVITFK